MAGVLRDKFFEWLLPRVSDKQLSMFFSIYSELDDYIIEHGLSPNGLSGASDVSDAERFTEAVLADKSSKWARSGFQRSKIQALMMHWENFMREAENEIPAQAPAQRPAVQQRSAQKAAVRRSTARAVASNADAVGDRQQTQQSDQRPFGDEASPSAQEQTFMQPATAGLDLFSGQDVFSGAASSSEQPAASRQTLSAADDIFTVQPPQPAKTVRRRERVRAVPAPSADELFWPSGLGAGSGLGAVETMMMTAGGSYDMGSFGTWLEGKVPAELMTVIARACSELDECFGGAGFPPVQFPSRVPDMTDAAPLHNAAHLLDANPALRTMFSRERLYRMQTALKLLIKRLEEAAKSEVVPARQDVRPAGRQMNSILPEEEEDFSGLKDADAAREELRAILLRQFAANSGYSNMILMHSAAANRLSDFMSENDIETPGRLYSAAKYLLGSEFIFYDIHIWKEDPDYPKDKNGLTEALARRNGGFVSRAETDDYFNEIRLSAPANGDLIKDGAFMFIDKDRFILTSYVNLTEERLSVIEDELTRAFERCGADEIPMSELSAGLLGAMPPLPGGASWTPLLLQEVIKVKGHYQKPRTTRGRPPSASAAALGEENASGAQAEQPRLPFRLIMSKGRQWPNKLAAAIAKI